MKTLICLILDRSGSMQGRESDVVGGVNAFIKEQQKVEGEADICLVRFDSEAIERFRPLQSLDKVVPLGIHEYAPRGGTPLLDAIGQSMDELESDWVGGGYDRGILLIVTDGKENASKVFTKAMIKERITTAQESGQWGVIYLGANVDAFSEAGQMGIHRSSIAGYTNNTMGIEVMYASASASVSNMRSAVGANWASTAALGEADLGEDKKAALEKMKSKLMETPSGG